MFKVYGLNHLSRLSASRIIAASSAVTSSRAYIRMPGRCATVALRAAPGWLGFNIATSGRLSLAWLLARLLPLGDSGCPGALLSLRKRAGAIHSARELGALRMARWTGSLLECHVGATAACLIAATPSTNRFLGRWLYHEPFMVGIDDLIGIFLESDDEQRWSEGRRMLAINSPWGWG